MANTISLLYGAGFLILALGAYLSYRADNSGINLFIAIVFVIIAAYNFYYAVKQ